MLRLLIVDDTGFDCDTAAPYEAKEITETREIDILSVTRMENVNEHERDDEDEGEDAFQSRRSPDSFYNIPSTVSETIQTSQLTVNDHYFDQTKLGLPRPRQQKRFKTQESETDTDTERNPEDSDEEYRPVPPVERKRKKMSPSAPAKGSRGRVVRGGREARGDDLSKAEKRKLTLKRQKNKEAAARCRQKKIDTIVTLEEAVKKHTEERLRLEATVFDLKKHIRLLEASLAGHSSACRLLIPDGHLNSLGPPRPRRPDTLNIAKPRSPTDILFTPSTFASLVDSLRSSPMSVPDCLLATPVTSGDLKLLTL